MDKKRALCGGCWFLANVLTLVSVPMVLEAAVLAGGKEWSLRHGLCCSAEARPSC